MSNTTWNLGYIREIVIMVLLVSGLTLLGIFLYAVYPQLKLVSGSTGRGVLAHLTPQTSFEQKITIPSEDIDALFIALDTPDEGHRITANLTESHSGKTFSLGNGRPELLTVGTQGISGATWPLPPGLETGSSYTVHLSLLPTSDTVVAIVADEYPPGSFEATTIRDDSNAPTPQGFTLSLILASRHPRWVDQTVSERQDYVRAASIVVVSTIVILLLAFLGTFLQIPKVIPKRSLIFLFVLLVIGAVTGRVWMASNLPLVNDEQFYVYDSILYNIHDPHFWKTPLLISTLRVWTAIIGIDSLVTIRLLIIISCVGALSLLSYNARQIGGKTAGWITLLVGFFVPTVMSYTSIIMTEQFMMLPLMAAIALTLFYRNKGRITWWQLVLIAGLTGLATAVRWSAIFWLVGIAILLRDSSLKEFSRRLVWLAAPFVAGGTAFLALFPEILVKYQIGGLFIEFFEASAEEGWIAKFLLWRQPALRLSLLMLPALLVLNGFPIKRRILYSIFAALFALLFFPAWQGDEIFPHYPISSMVFFGLALGFLLVGVGVGGKYKRRTIMDAMAFLVPPLLTYAIFHKVNDKYLAEFIPALVLFAGLGLASVLESLWYRRSIAAAVALLLLAYLLPPWTYYPFDYPYAGTIAQGAVRDSIEYLKNHVADDERILAASVLVPLMAHKQLAYPVSHPSWLEPTFRGEPDPRYYALFDPIADDIEAGNVEWVLDGKLLADTYRRHPRIDEAIKNLYEVEVEIENEGTRPFTLLRLKR
ncbi:MAG: hypothetical protein HYR90_03140 [Candidatus Andersenbacteria bacterium]|nr:hypothetical protein [Candidatus Andersenbacteria bacterium]MBI3250258.1 hypothetical protein [Candidatus Andersenbacteria bacterium]